MNRLFKKLAIWFIVLVINNLTIEAQQARYTFQFKQLPLKEVLKEVTEKTKINILYNPNIISSDFRVSGKFVNIPISQLLDSLLKSSAIQYKVYKNTYILCKRNEEIKVNHKLAKYSGSLLNKNMLSDTITYSVIMHDTVVTTLTEYLKKEIQDTIRIYDTIQVVRESLKTENWAVQSNRFAVGISASYGLLRSTVKSNRIDQTLLNVINSSLTGQSVTSVNIDLEWQYKRLKLETGFGYQNYAYSLKYSELKANKLEQKYNTQLYYRSVQVPFSLSFVLINKRFSISTQVGTSVNYYVSSDGFYLNVIESNLKIEDKKAPEVSTNYSFLGGCELGYMISKYFQVHVKPYVAYTLPLTQGSAIYYNEAIQIGTYGGIRFCF